ncbi:Clathrin interactor EPSIN like [Actinidia chinensis var. chinensis]|uniref:Clathrin interactor EPSIN like n=1 Tax=Actinidia chinensis var. chinensis TaxID=1590841 RepID=A0A2R6S0W2_ACTCC|nr:Clathrin interactor EPSIN like [Actinidia chinensis var. chinensis]
MKKAFGQTVRELKREVNKKVLKVPGIEQKVLDATSNEPWGPHGTLLAEIALATKNYHEYQMIMSVIWKRINDTGKNWRHVYKGLTVLEYLVAHGSERVIDEIREHAYQISTLSDFQYIDSTGKDQGSNVRKKSQSLVVLVNDKERLQELRQKAAANRDKFRNVSMGGMHRPNTGGYDDDRYDGRYGRGDDDRNGYGREREWGSRDDDRSGRYGDAYGRDGDRYSRDSDERSGRDGYRDDDYRGRSRSIDDYQYGSRSRSSDRERDRAYEDDGHYSSRGSGARADDHSQDGGIPGKRLERKFSEQNLGAPPTYEEAVGDGRSPVYRERDGETSAASAPTSASLSASPNQAIPAPGMPAAPVPVPASASPPAPAPASPPAPAYAPAPSPSPAFANKEVDGFDEFDPRGSFSAVPVTSNSDEMDLLGSLSESFSNPLAITLVTPATADSEANAATDFNSGPTNLAASTPFGDPFGDGPFRALPSADGAPSHYQNITPTSSFHPSTNQPQSVAEVDTVNHGDTYPGMTFNPSLNPNAQFSPQEFPTSDQTTDILADILPPSGPLPPVAPQTGFAAQADQSAAMTGFIAQTGQSATHSGFPPQSQNVYSAQPSQPHAVFLAQTSQPASMTGFPAQDGFPGQISSASHTGFTGPNPHPAQPGANFYGTFLQQQGRPASSTPHLASQTITGPTSQYNTPNFLPQTSPAAPVVSQMAPQIPGGPSAPHNNDALGNFVPQAQPTSTMTSQPPLTPSTGSLAIVPQPGKDKFETKSTVWADTLSRGLVNLNISGSKINPLSDIGIDFDAINRKEKRMEKPTNTPVISTITMGKAMGSGSGMGRAGAGALRPPPNPMVGSGMGMGMGMGGGPGAGMGMGGYRGMNQQPMGMGMGMNMGMGMGMGQGQGTQMQPSGFPPGSSIPGGYNPMMGRGGYVPQQPYGGRY